MPPTQRTFDYYDHRIYLEPLRPGVWRYRVYQLVVITGSTLMRCGPLVCDKETLTKWNAEIRARDVVRRRRRRNARWPHLRS